MKKVFVNCGSEQKSPRHEPKNELKFGLLGTGTFQTQTLSLLMLGKGWQCIHLLAEGRFVILNWKEGSLWQVPDTYLAL